MRVITYAAACAALLVGALAVFADAGQKNAPGTPPLVIESMYGPDLYRHYCATCHGRDAKGSGPAAAALKVPPPDLTALARRRNGAFPAVEVEAIILGGRVVASHGSDEMPVWGPIFHALDPSNGRIKARINALVSHLASLQQK